MVNTKINLCGTVIDNPVIPASGTFGFGYEFSEIYDINMLGTFSFKGTTKEARFGNPTPRIAECPSGMINSVGLQNPGVDAVIKEDVKLVGLSALMTTTVKSMAQTIKALREAGAECKVMVGGAVLNKEYADMVGADFYVSDATESAKVAAEILG